MSEDDEQELITYLRKLSEGVHSVPSGFFPYDTSESVKSAALARTSDEKEMFGEQTGYVNVIFVNKDSSVNVEIKPPVGFPADVAPNRRYKFKFDEGEWRGNIGAIPSKTILFRVLFFNASQEWEELVPDEELQSCNEMGISLSCLPSDARGEDIVAKVESFRLPLRYHRLWHARCVAAILRAIYPGRLEITAQLAVQKKKPHPFAALCFGAFISAKINAHTLPANPWEPRGYFHKSSNLPVSQKTKVLKEIQMVGPRILVSVRGEKDECDTEFFREMFKGRGWEAYEAKIQQDYEEVLRRHGTKRVGTPAAGGGDGEMQGGNNSSVNVKFWEERSCLLPPLFFFCCFHPPFFLWSCCVSFEKWIEDKEREKFEGGYRLQTDQSLRSDISTAIPAPPAVPIIEKDIRPPDDGEDAESDKTSTTVDLGAKDPDETTLAGAKFCEILGTLFWKILSSRSRTADRKSLERMVYLLLHPDKFMTESLKPVLKYMFPAFKAAQEKE